MIIQIGDLVRMLEMSGLPQDGVSPSDMLAVNFGPATGRIVESEEYERIDGGTMIVDYASNKDIVSIELVNPPRDR